MTVKRLFIVLMLLAAFSMEAAAATTVIVQVKNNADINSIAAALGGSVIDSMPDGSSYLLSLPFLPATWPAGVQSVTQNTPLILPRFKGAALAGPSSSGTLPWYANQPALQLVKAAQARANSTGRGIII